MSRGLWVNPERDALVIKLWTQTQTPQCHIAQQVGTTPATVRRILARHPEAVRVEPEPVVAVVQSVVIPPDGPGPGVQVKIIRVDGLRTCVDSGVVPRRDKLAAVIVTTGGVVRRYSLLSHLLLER